MNRSMKQKENHRHREQTVVAKVGGGWGRMEWQGGVSRCNLLHIDWIKNSVLLYSTVKYIQYLMINHSGKNILKKNYICV